MVPSDSFGFQLTLIMVGLSSVLSAIQFLKFQRQSETPARMLHHYYKLNDVSLSECSLLCHDDMPCKSVNYRTETRTCEHVNVSVYNDDYEMEQEAEWRTYAKEADPSSAVSPGNGSYGTPCNDVDDCQVPNTRCVNSNYHVFGKICLCEPLYEYVEANGSCEQVCDSFGTTYTQHTNSTIFRYGLFMTNGGTVQTLANCQQLCSDKGTKCQAIEHDSQTGICNFKSINWQVAIALGVAETEQPNHSVYVKNCG